MKSFFLLLMLLLHILLDVFPKFCLFFHFNSVFYSDFTIEELLVFSTWALKTQGFHFHWPIPQFCRQLCDCGNHMTVLSVNSLNADLVGPNYVLGKSFGINHPDLYLSEKCYEI